MTTTLTLPPVYKIVQSVVTSRPAVFAHLRGMARWMAAKPVEYKTYEFFLSTLRSMVRKVYDGVMGGDFVDVMASLIQGQVNQAYRQAWKDEGDGGKLPEYLEQAAEAQILGQYDFVDGYFKDIVTARLDETPIEPLLTRAELWANQYNIGYGNAVALITEENGGRMVWKLGATEKHCPFCEQFDGLVAFASEWAALGIKPQNAPNPVLTGTLNGEKGCEGWRCDCSLEPTDKRRSPNVYGRLEEILLSR